jgi:hypothetical protein
MAYKSLDNILNDESDTTAELRPAMPEPAVETGDTPQPEPAQATEVDAGTPPAEDARKAGLEAGIAAERKKRQDAEALVEQLRREAEAKTKEPPAPAPSIWEDEQGAFQHFGGQVVNQAVQQATFNARLDMSEMMARQANPDFEDMKAEFLQMAQQNPVIAQQALADAHPWQKAYQIAKNARTMNELGATDIQSLEAKIREQVMAEMQAQTPAAPRIPPSLSTSRNVSSRNGPPWSGPPSLGELLK